jgi:hypothetical protein
VGSGLEISFFIPRLSSEHVIDRSIVDLQVIRNLFERIPVAHMRIAHMLISLCLRLRLFKEFSKGRPGKEYGR